MNSIEIQKVEQSIEQNWEQSDERVALFHAILDECVEDDHPSITVSQIRKHTDLEVREILEFMAFLCGDYLYLFEAQFHIYDAGKFHPVTVDYVCDSLDKGFVEVPETGVKYDDVVQRITMYYEPTPMFLPLRAKKASETIST